MKEVTVKQTVTKYVADDGEEFSNSVDCLEHERRAKAATAERQVRALKRFYADPPYADDDEVWFWYYVKSQEDVENIASVFFNADSVAHEFRPKSFPCWVAATLDSAAFDEMEAGAGRMIEYSDYVADQKDFDTRLVAEMERLGEGGAE